MKTFENGQVFSEFKRKVEKDLSAVSEEKCSRFLNDLARSIKSKKPEEIPLGCIMYRAQVAHDVATKDEYGLPVTYSACSEKRLRPDEKFAGENRASPEGVAYFYCATKEAIAQSEVRPNNGELITLGTFITNKNLKLVEFRNKAFKGFFNRMYGKNCTNEEIEQSVWAEMNYWFSYPVSGRDDKVEYRPTQEIAKLVEILGYDGIIYDSIFDWPTDNNSKPIGSNIVLFDQSSLDFQSADLLLCKKTDYEFQPCGKEPFWFYQKLFSWLPGYGKESIT